MTQLVDECLCLGPPLHTPGEPSNHGPPDGCFVYHPPQGIAVGSGRLGAKPLIRVIERHGVRIGEGHVGFVSRLLLPRP